MLRASRGGWGVAMEESVVDSFHIHALIGTALSDNIGGFGSLCDKGLA